MEFSLVSTCAALVFIFLVLKHFHREKYHLPPSPSPTIPVIGHLHLLKPPLHRTLNLFSQKLGPIFSLQLGVRRVVVVSSPDLAEECFTAANDVVLSNRPRVLVDEYIGYDHTTMAGAPYGRQWRNLRRLGAQEVLSAARLNALSHVRQDEVRRTLKTLIPQNGEQWRKVELRPILFELVFNIITRMLAGKRYCGGGGEGEAKLGEEFREMVGEVLEHSQSSNPEDFLPFLRWVDYRGLKRKLGGLRKKLDDFYQSLLEEHRREKRNTTIIGHLLYLQESDPDFYTDQTIKGFITNMIIAGTDTSVVTVEWAMSLLLNHPQVLEKARLELDSRVGSRRFLEEQDLPNLPFMRNIISETFRMFPAGPLGVPREASADCKIGGYDVPRGTLLLVNAWAIHRDPRVWDEPTSFKPERFEGREVETQTFLPFGMGRRACPGSGLGQRMVGLGLGSLIQCFDWERVSLEEVDLAEGVGLTMPKLNPLQAMCRPRDIIMLDVSSELI